MLAVILNEHVFQPGFLQKQSPALHRPKVSDVVIGPLTALNHHLGTSIKYTSQADFCKDDIPNASPGVAIPVMGRETHTRFPADCDGEQRL